MHSSIHFKSNKQMTHHATVRQQQRGVSEFVIDLLMEFGICRDAGENAISIWANKGALKEIKSYVGSSTYSTIESQLKRIYLIVNTAQVITVAYVH